MNQAHAAGRWSLWLERSTTPLLALGLVIAVMAVYWPVRQYPFIMVDDPLYVVINEHVRAGLTAKSIAWAFTTFEAGSWHPLTWLSHMLDCSVFGANAAGAQHMVSVSLHAANTLLVFVIFKLMTRATWRSAIVAAVFGLHPLRIESVAWIAERKDVLSAFFGLLAILAYVTHARSPRWWRLLVVALLMALSLLAKPTLVTLPCLLLLLDVWPLRRVDLASSNAVVVRRIGVLALEKAPLFLLSIASSVMTIYGQHAGQAVAPLKVLSMSERLQTAITGIARYVDLTVWPRGLAIIYPLHPWPIWQWLPSLLLVIAVSVLSFLRLRRQPYLAVGWFWFLGSLIPMIGIVQVGAQSIADRYTYVPSIGLALIVVWPLGELTRRAPGPMRAMGGLVALAAVTALTWATYKQLQFWRGSEVLFRRAVDVTGPNWFAHNLLGIVHLNNNQNEAAVQEFATALRVNPRMWEPWRNLATVLARLGQWTPAIDAYRKTLALRPDQAAAMNNLAALLLTNPDPRVRNAAEAMPLAERACELTDWQNPGHLDTLAAAYAQVDRFEDAVRVGSSAEQLALAAGKEDLARLYAQKVARYRSRQRWE